MSETFDPYRKWLGISPKKRPPSHYDLLGVSIDEEDADVVTAAHQQRRAFVESQRGSGQDAAVAEVLYRLDEAKLTLLDRDLRREYDRKQKLFAKRSRRRQVDPGDGSVRRPPRVVSGGKAASTGDDFLRTYGGIVAILTLAFGAMLWWSFRQPWSDPPAVAEETQPNALFDALADDPATRPEATGEAPQTETAAPDPVRLTDPPAGTFLVRWTEDSGGAGEVEYEFKPDGSVWKAGRHIGVLRTSSGQHVVDFTEQVRGEVQLADVSPDAFNGRHRWQSGRAANWIATRIDPPQAV